MEQENQLALLAFIKKFKEACPNKTLWIFTGYVYERDLLYGKRKYIHGVTNAILDYTDILVDGPFIEEKKNLTLKFRGSSNQRLLSKEDRVKLAKAQ